MENISLKKLNIHQFREAYKNLCIADLRGKQSFEAARLQDSLNFQNDNEIISYIKENSITKPLLLLCFTKQRSKKISEQLLNNVDFVNAYNFKDLYYLDSGFMELDESGLPILESPPPPRE